MPSILPHSRALRTKVRDFVSEAESGVASCLQDAQTSGAFRNIYKVCLAFDASVAGLSRTRLTPSVKVMRETSKRVPLLIALGQSLAAAGELRRLVELVFWTVFFTDHPVEWHNLVQNPGRGYIKSQDDPISYLACREPSFYENYAMSRLSQDPSGLACKAVSELKRERGNLSSVVHPGKAAAGVGSTLPFDEVSDEYLNSFAKTLRVVLPGSAVILMALKRKQFENLTALQRAWFDWFIGKSSAKRIRMTGFGLAN